jgi:subtilisin family serine protease
MGIRRSRWVLGSAGVVAVVALAALIVTPALGARGRRTRADARALARAQQLAQKVDDHVIIVFKNQLNAVPDVARDRTRRIAAVAAIQHGVLAELRATHATDVHSVQLVNAVAAEVSHAEAQRVAANPAVAKVIRDEPIPVVGSLPTVSPGARFNTPSSSSVLPGACPAPGSVQLDPEAVELIHAAEEPGGPPSAQSLGYTGAGVKVAFIADGLDINNPDFIRADGSHVFVDYQDFSGTGSDAPTDGAEAFEDASSIAAQGNQVYSLSGFGMPSSCEIRILGVAPGASLVGLNVFGSSNFAYNSVFLEALNYAVNTDHVNVVNESFGSNPFPDAASLDLTRMADEAAVAAGVTVTVSSGDAGVTDTIGSPATDPAVISAGATTSYRAYAQSGVGGITYPGVTGWLDNNISGLSSAGFDQAGGTVDVVAPGDLNWALCSPDPSLYAACTDFYGNPSSIELAGGTSEAAPLTAGVAALVIQAYEEAHGGSAPTPAVVKQIIVSTTQDIDAPAEQQGAGLLDAYAAVQAAASYGGSSSATGAALIKSATQLNATGPEGTSETLSETVTNDGATTQDVTLSSRALGAYTPVSRTTVQIADKSDDEATVTFEVPAGQARLNASIAYVGAGPSTDFGAAMNLSLISPSGQLAEYNLPQGTGNYGNAQVADPQAGTWTAVIYNSAPSVDGGTVGPVHFEAATAPWTSFGTLSTDSLTLAPGASQTFTLQAATPSSPGDAAGSIVLTSDASGEPSFATTTTIPVTLRALIPTPTPAITFAGTLTGGNGRDFSSGQTAYYQVNIPSGVSELNASIATFSKADTFYAELIDPSTGQAASTTANGIPGLSVPIISEFGGQLHVLNPAPGTWTLAINFYNQVSGTAISQPFFVTLNDRSVPVKATLPDAATTMLTAGTSTNYSVRVTNTGTTTEAYFVDARLSGSTQLDLAPQVSSQTAVPITGNIPLYVVPTHTSSITATATAAAPVYFDYWSAFGDPDLMSSLDSSSDTASGTFTDSPVVAGIWGISPFQYGPDGTSGVAPVTASTSIVATTAPFDPAVSTATGDFWLQSENAGEEVNPVFVAPGQTTTIPVTITPTAAAGQTVTGTLYLDDLTDVNGQATWNEINQNVEQASDLAAIPYEYTVQSASSGSHRG